MLTLCYGQIINLNDAWNGRQTLSIEFVLNPKLSQLHRRLPTQWMALSDSSLKFYAYKEILLQSFAININYIPAPYSIYVQTVRILDCNHTGAIWLCSNVPYPDWLVRRAWREHWIYIKIMCSHAVLPDASVGLHWISSTAAWCPVYELWLTFQSVPFGDQWWIFLLLSPVSRFPKIGWNQGRQMSVRVVPGLVGDQSSA